jgi:hypothetical protein
MDHSYGACLRSFLPHLFSEGNTAAYTKLAEMPMKHGVLLEVDLAVVCRLQEAVSLLSEEFLYHPFLHFVSCLDEALLLACIVLQPSPHFVKGLVNGALRALVHKHGLRFLPGPFGLEILQGSMKRRRMLDYELTVWHTQINPHVEEFAGLGSLRTFHNYTAAVDPMIEVLQFGGFFLYQLFQSCVVLYVSKRHLNWQ